MKVTKGGGFTRLVSNVVASGVAVDDPGGFFGGPPLTLEEVLALIGAGLAGPYLTIIRGGQGTTQDLGTLGSTATVDLANANYFFGTLAEDCTLTTTGWTSDKDSQITVELTEDGTGGWTPTFDGVTFIGGTPTWDTTLDTVTVVVLFSRDGGTTIYGVVVGGGSGVSSGPGDPGADVVLVATGVGSVTIPGMSGSPDAVPASPDAFDDEFDALSGWTTLGSLDSLNVTDAPSHLHLKKASTGVQYNGIYKTAPSMPFTCTIKVSDFALDTQYQSCGILLTEASPGKLASFDLAIAGGSWYLALRRWTNRTTFASSVDLAISNLVLGAHVIRYLRLVVASSTDITCQWSARGHVWNSHATLSNLDPSLTIANVGIGLGVPVSSSVTCDLFADWVRFE